MFIVMNYDYGKTGFKYALGIYYYLDLSHSGNSRNGAHEKQ